MSDDPEGTKELEGLQLDAVGDKLMSAGRQKVRQAVQYGASALVGMVAVVAMSWVMSAIEGRVPAEITTSLAEAQAQEVATWTPTPAWGRSAELQVGDRVEAAPRATPASVSEGRLWRIIDDLEGRLLEAQKRNIVLEEEIAAAQGPQDVVRSQARGTQNVVAAAADALPLWASELVAACEDGGGCPIPPNAPVARLCGVEGLGGYVVRWQGVHGDSFAGHVASADYMRGFGLQEPTVIWQRPHPRTGETVSIVWLPREMQIQLDVSGRPQWRLRADGKYTQF